MFSLELVFELGSDGRDEGKAPKRSGKSGRARMLFDRKDEKKAKGMDESEV